MKKLESIKDMIDSEMFLINLQVEYLNKYILNSEVSAYLVKRLQTQETDRVLFYLPQLCFMSFQNEHIFNFLQEKAKESIPVCLKILWIIDALAEQQYKFQAEKLERMIETSMVNSSIQLDQNQPMEKILIEIENKQVRQSYNQYNSQMILDLIKFSTQPKTHANKDKQLYTFLHQINKKISHERRNSLKSNNVLEKKLKQGMILPLDFSKKNSNQVIIQSRLYVQQKKNLFVFQPDKELPTRQSSKLSTLLKKCKVLIPRQYSNQFKNYWKKLQQTIVKSKSKCHQKLQYFLQQDPQKIVRVNSIDSKQSNSKREKRRNSVGTKNQAQNMISFIDQHVQQIVRQEKHANKIQKFLEIKLYIQQENDLIQYTQKKAYKPKIVQIWDQLWQKKSACIQQFSPFRKYNSYMLRQFIVKGGDDLMQEHMAMQLIYKFKEIFSDLPLYLRPYEILVMSQDSGFIECVPDTYSVDQLKKQFNQTLLHIYQHQFAEDYIEIQKNFAESLAAYSLVCYFLEVKDRQIFYFRHNGNILIDNLGHLIHIDFGFIFQACPGGIRFESAPFKLTKEYIEILEGYDSDMFQYFSMLMVRGFLALRQNLDQLLNLLVPIVHNRKLECFNGFSLENFQQKFQQKMTEAECITHVKKLIENSADNWRTNYYDNFQRKNNGIMS